MAVERYAVCLAVGCIVLGCGQRSSVELDGEMLRADAIESREGRPDVRETLEFREGRLDVLVEMETIGHEEGRFDVVESSPESVGEVEDGEGVFEVREDLGPPDCDDGNPCTQHTLANDGRCEYEAVGGSCPFDGACGAVGVCVEGLCRVVDVPECLDGEFCTFDYCEDGKCVRKAWDPPFSGCCLSPHDCWNPAGAECHDFGCRGACFKGTPGSCDDGNDCTCDVCVYEVCHHIPKPQGHSILPCQFGPHCCATDGECEDGDTSTCNICDKGRCVLVGPQSDTIPRRGANTSYCCSDEINCSDGSECTLSYCVEGEGCQHVTLPDGTRCRNEPQFACLSGVCVCVPVCALGFPGHNKPCDPDGCGGTCGECEVLPLSDPRGPQISDRTRDPQKIRSPAILFPQTRL